MERVVLALTNRCNLLCRHCYAEGGAPLEAEMDQADLESVIAQAASLGVRVLILSGGEPLLAMRLLIPAVARARAAGLHVTVTTNGTLITPGTAALLKDIGVNTLQVSLDSDRPEEHDYIRGRGTHDRAVQGLMSAVAAGLHSTVMMVAFKHNWRRVGHLAARAAGLGAKLLAVDRFTPVGRGRTESELELGSADLRGLHAELWQLERAGGIRVATNDPIWNALKLAKAVPPNSNFEWARSAPVGCSAGTGSCVVAADGQVYPCTFLQIPLGNVRSRSLAGILAKSDVVAALADRDRLEGKCAECRLRLICGGCRAEALARPGGSLLGEDPLCPVPSRPN